MEIVLDKEAIKVIKYLAKYHKNSIEYKLLEEIFKSFEMLENELINELDIKNIKNNKLLKEIRIKKPLNYRIFFVEEDNTYYIVLDIIEKKVNKFSQKYFTNILKRIERNKVSTNNE